MIVPDGPGLGIEIDWEEVEALKYQIGWREYGIDHSVLDIHDMAWKVNIGTGLKGMRKRGRNNMWEPKKINLLELLEPHPPRTNFHVITVDKEYTVRVAKMAGRFPWHYHPHRDEGWFIFEGRLRIDTETGSVELGRGDFTVIAQGTRHSPEVLVPNTIVLIFNKRQLGMVLDQPDVDLGDFREEDLHPSE